MTQSPTAPEIAQLGHALMLGTRKRPIALPPAALALLFPSGGTSPAMLALVLAGQHARFERPSAPALALALDTDRALHADPRPMLSDASRRLLKQLLSLTKGDAPEMVFHACRDRAAAYGLRLHPFDLPALAPYLRTAESPGAVEGDASAPPGLDAATWKAMPQERRADALRRFRHAAPDAARALLEATFRTETAPDRATFLGVMAIHLGPADLPFLEAAAKDRAEAVRATAQRMAGCIPGTDAHRQRLDGAVGIFKPRGAGRKTAETSHLALVNCQAIDANFQALDGLKVADLAERFGVTPGGFIDILPSGQDSVTLPLIVSSAQGGDFAHAAALIRRLTGSRALVDLWTYRPDGLDVAEEGRPAIVEALVDLALAGSSAGSFPSGQSLHAYYRLLRGPLPEPLAARLLASGGWRTHIGRLAQPEADHRTPDAVKEAALLIPDSLLGEFLASIAALSPHITLPARLFAAFCHSLAQTTPVAPLTQSPA